MKTTSAAATEFHYRNGSDGDGVFTMWSFSGRVWYAAIKWDAIPEALRLTEDVRRHWDMVEIELARRCPDGKRRLTGEIVVAQVGVCFPPPAVSEEIDG